jgi:HAE1 family hydrophobic/amphiphilic exporter-1
MENDVVPPGYTWEITGENEMTEESFEGIKYGLILALLLIYTILVAVFDSAIQPLVIMLSIPFSIVGVVLGLLVTDTAFGLLPGIAIVALSGIVVNDAIVLIDYINYLRKQGMDKKTAVVEGGKTRMRPIFMTSLTTSLAVLPLTLGTFGTGAEWRPFGVALISGLMAATILILVVIPSFYYIITNWEDRLIERKKKRDAMDLERWKKMAPKKKEGK